MDNAFWACADHGRLIDTNEGSRYPAGMLQSYKDLHESRIALELGHKVSTRGWFHRLRVVDDPHFHPFELFFGDATLITGYPGKTAICERIAGCVDVGHLWRWWPDQGRSASLHYELTVYDPRETVLTVRARALHDIALLENGEEVPIWSRSLRTVFVEHFEDYRSESDELSFVSKILRIESMNASNLLSSANDMKMFGVSDLRVRLADGGNDLVGDLEGTRRGLSFAQWSHSERVRVLVVLAFALARFFSKRQPTILILDCGMSFLDKQWFERLCKEISARKWGFQVIISRITHSTDIKWSGWTHLRIAETAKGAEIVADVIRPG